MVFEDVVFGLYNFGLRGKEFRKCVEEVFGRVGMFDYINWEMKVFSFGEKKRIVIVIVLVMEFEVIVFDEFFVNFDFKGKKVVREIIFGLKWEGKIVIFVSYEVEYFFFCDRIVLMDGGKIVKVGFFEEVFGNFEFFRGYNFDVLLFVEFFLRFGLKVLWSVEEGVELLKM